jgi:glycosyltransferase involved in cell wall biosynthesis
VGPSRQGSRRRLPGADSAPVKRLLLVTHRPIQDAGGPAARWRSFVRYLPEHGWEVEVISPSGGGQREFGASPEDLRRALLRARVMARVGRLGDPLFALMGLRPEALPPSMAWIPRASLEIRRRLGTGRYTAILATGPPMSALPASRLGTRGETIPLVIELRDLWAGNPAFDRDSSILGRAERWVLAGANAVIALTPEAVADLRHRHRQLADRIIEIPNGFEPELLDRRRNGTGGRPLTILHSGALTTDRPIAPLLDELAAEPNRSAFRLVLHGYVDPAIRRQIDEAAGFEVEVRPPSSWEEAVQAIAAADVGLISQSRGAGDETAVAAKVYEYLALGKSVLCLSDGGATEALLRRLGADEFCARLGNQPSISAALERLRTRPLPPPLPPQQLAPYDRRVLANRMAGTLDRFVLDASV